MAKSKGIVERLSKPFLIIFAVVCMVPGVVAQNPAPSDSQSNENQSWNASGNSQGAIPTRSTESHTQRDGRTVDKQSLEIRGVDGRYQPYRDVETEKIRVDATTTRTVQRTYGRGPDGQRTLIEVREDETRTQAGGDQKTVRTTSNPDGNGRLQVVQREVEETRQSSPGVSNTKTTVFTPDTNGGFSPAVQSEERDTQKNNGSVEFRKTTRLPDGNGGWQVQEVREGVTEQENAKSSSKEERVLRPGSDGNLSVVERTVTKESESPTGEKRQTVETYSTDIAGASSDGRLRLNQRVTSTHRTGTDGAQISEEQVEQRNPAEPGAPPRVTQKTIDIVRPGLSNASTETRTVQSLDSSGKLGTVWVDTRKTESTPAVQVDTKQSKNPDAVKVDTKAQPKQP